MRRLVLALALAVAQAAPAQEVAPDALSLSVTVEAGTATPFVGEMVLVTIHGVYRRHITRERLQQPDLEGFSWMQLGDDYWYPGVIDGRPVKNMRRRMALFPEAPGRLSIGAFTHHLTLLDADDAWFEHAVASAPVTVDVRPQPEVEDWWLPVRRLEVSDQWSNAPDRLQPGEGVLRVVRVEATGIPPERLPPMPELASPSGHVFPHPEKRLVSLSPEGPVSTAFWRWTIKPAGPSAILEPIGFDYFDTVARQTRRVTITPQRVATAPGEPPAEATPPAAGQPSRATTLAAFAVGAAGGLVALGWRRRRRDGAGAPIGRRLVRRIALAQAVRRQDAAAFRRLVADGTAGPEAARVLDRLDAALFGPSPSPPDLRSLARQLVARAP